MASFRQCDPDIISFKETSTSEYFLIMADATVLKSADLSSDMRGQTFVTSANVR